MKIAKPIVKWLGGKRLLVPELRKRYPAELGDAITMYVEPFVGGGAVLFDVLSNYKMDDVYISDANKSLINMYTIVRDNPEELIYELGLIQSEYLEKSKEDRTEMYYTIRESYNELLTSDFSIPSMECVTYFIFLNKTCFSGLYRVNSKGKFNAAIGNYKHPIIFDRDNILYVSELLQDVHIWHQDYKVNVESSAGDVFVYLDPPYRPITDTASKSAYYTKGGFNDDDQRELANLLYELDKRGSKFMLSNSDQGDGFFDELYSSFNIERLDAHRGMRTLDDDSSKVCHVSEILVTNYSDYKTPSNPQTNLLNFEE